MDGTIAILTVVLILAGVGLTMVIFGARLLELGMRFARDKDQMTVTGLPLVISGCVLGAAGIGIAFTAATTFSQRYGGWPSPTYVYNQAEGNGAGSMSARPVFVPQGYGHPGMDGQPYQPTFQPETTIPGVYGAASTEASQKLRLVAVEPPAMPPGGSTHNISYP